MARILVVANQKGGIGKSTSVANLARALTERQYRVLIIDLDPQGGVSATVGVDSFNVKRSTYTLLMKDKVNLEKVMRRVGPNLAIVPASIDLAAAEVQLAKQSNQVQRLRYALNHNALPFDYILIDTPPTLGILTANGLVAAQELLIPVQAQYLAMRGIRGLLQTVEQITKKLNPELRLLGIFVTMFDARARHAQEVLDELHTVFGAKVFQTVLPYDEVVAEAPIAHQSVLDYAPEHPVSQAYRQLAQEIIQRGETNNV